MENKGKKTCPAVDWSKLTDDQTVKSELSDFVPAQTLNESNITSSLCSPSSSSFAAVASHPMVQSQRFPERLRDVLLIPHFEGQKKKSVRITTSARVLTSDEHRELFSKKLQDAAEKEEQRIRRKAIREQKRAEEDLLSQYMDDDPTIGECRFLRNYLGAQCNYCAKTFEAL